MSVTVEVGGSTLVLLPERAALWPDERLLLVADAHFGKAQTFRRLGVPVPGGTTAANLQRLTTLIERHGVQEVVFLGDLLHGRLGRSAATADVVTAWRECHAGVAMRLVRGNHDHHAGDPPASWRIMAVDSPCRRGPWALCHHPTVVDGAYALAGHVHPGVHLGRGSDRLRLPCFHLGPASGVLPAFGAFTGLGIVTRQPQDRVYAIADDVVRLVP
jgi:uncharacterized protein